MRNSLARQIVAETPAEVKQFVRRYAELTMRIHEIMEAKAWTQKELAEKMGKSPSEISKWLNGEHNFTLKSLAKLEVELGEDLIQVPKHQKFQVVCSKVIHLEVAQTVHSVASKADSFTQWEQRDFKSYKLSIA